MKKLLLLFLFLISITISAQVKTEIENIRELFQDFQYNQAITKIDSLISIARLRQSNFNEIMMYKAVAYYALSKDDSVEKSFLEIINVDPLYIPDSTIFSPKIISYYSKVKNNYLAGYKIKRETQLNYAAKFRHEYNNIIFRSLALPGWGHIYMGERSKGYILTSAGGVSLFSFLYFLIDANNKETAFINEKDPKKVNERKSDYIQSKSIKTFSLITYAFIWVYSQLDVMVFTDLHNMRVIYADNPLPFNNDYVGLEFKIPVSF
ncbi:MAG TPA: hypothetical protein VFF33_12165 [Ignavibacteriaceae bacterium]|nr:hypothetical protein [Ignavibacteriaceae bacterium]